MDTRTFFEAILIIGIIVLAVYFVWISHKRRGDSPSLAAECFLFFDQGKPSPSVADASATAASLKLAIATPGQVALYASDGGSASAAGITSTGEVYWAPGSPYLGQGTVEKLATGDTGTSFPYGIWMYGPKPAKGSVPVVAFSCSHWYQPPPQTGQAPANVATTTAAHSLKTAHHRFSRRKTQLVNTPRHA